MPQAMNTETEIKLPVRDIEIVLGRLKRLGARNRGRVFEDNVLYDTRDGQLRRAGWLLRMRTEAPAANKWSPAGAQRAVITSKAPAKKRNSKYKQRIERETEIREPRHWPGILVRLGFRQTFRYEKFRTSFRVGGLHVDLDETPVGIFLELEGRGQAIDEVAKGLGYSFGEYLRSTYWDVYAADCRRRGVRTRNMVFNKKKIAKSALFA
jgi:adenylate cyclase class 2